MTTATIHHFRLSWKNVKNGAHSFLGYVNLDTETEDDALYFTLQCNKPTASAAPLLTEFKLYDKLYKQDTATGALDESDSPINAKVEELYSIILNPATQKYDYVGKEQYREHFNIVKKAINLKLL